MPFDRAAASEHLDVLKSQAQLHGCEPGTQLALDIEVYQLALDSYDALAGAAIIANTAGNIIRERDEKIVRLNRLAGRVANLNPAVPEIGAGMLANLVGEARELVGAEVPATADPVGFTDEQVRHG